MFAQAKSQFPIMASHALGNGHGTVENYKTIEEAGFTLSIAYLNSRDEVIRHLEAASKTSVKLIVWCPEILTDPEETINAFKKYRSLGGYYLSDEPNSGSFSELSGKYDLFQRIDKKHHIWINVYPKYATNKQLGTKSYENYINQYIKIINPKFVSFDHYGLMINGLRSDYFENLEIVSKQCRIYGKPFWAYVLSAEFGDYLPPTKGSLSFQAYSNIAYGAQGIEYYTYQKGRHKSAIVDENYQKLPIYNAVKELNSEIRYYSKFLTGNKVEEVSHFSREIPKGTKRTDKTIWGLTLKKYSGKGFVVSQFTNKKKKFILFVNKDYEKPQVLEISSIDSIRRISYYKIERIKCVGEHSFVVQPGSIVLLRL